MEERVFTPDTVEYRDAYMKYLMGKSMSIEERTALTVAANVIPTETLNKIYGKLEENQLINEIDALYVPGYVSVPTASTVDDANWIAMASASTDSSDAMGTVSLTAKKLIKTIEITADIQAMSIPAFQGWLVNKLAQKMEAAICAASSMVPDPARSRRALVSAESLPPRPSRALRLRNCPRSWAGSRLRITTVLCGS